MRRIDPKDLLLGVADLVALRATCSRLQVGAVLARDGRIISSGYNGNPRGVPHCDHSTDDPRMSCQTAVHAEANAITFAARYGMATQGCEMYITHAPCLSCAKLIINAGVVSVSFRKWYRDRSGVKYIQDNSDIPVDLWVPSAK